MRRPARSSGRRSAPAPGSLRNAAAGFTLLEMLAVVLIMGLVASIVIPAVGARSVAQLKNQANHLANDLEFARQRTVMTAVPHRLLLDLDGAAYRVEYYVTEAEALGGEVPAEDPDAALSEQKNLDLKPPRGEERSFHPLPTGLGRTVVLSDGIEFASVETEQGPVDRGAVSITFARDGTVDPTTIVLMDGTGNRLALELAPLDEAVVVRDAG